MNVLSCKKIIIMPHVRRNACQDVSDFDKGRAVIYQDCTLLHRSIVSHFGCDSKDSRQNLKSINSGTHNSSCPGSQLTSPFLHSTNRREDMFPTSFMDSCCPNMS
ncbi:hypothetical protein TNCV_3996311 [Trichonephila clavipes]|nr:hypothetical protein TNCV_3996311 [Trichonephila clavipes]